MLKQRGLRANPCRFVIRCSQSIILTGNLNHIWMSVIHGPDQSYQEVEAQEKALHNGRAGQ